MDGLNLILQKIEEDNKLEVNRIISDAQKTAENIIASAEEEVKIQADKIIADADKKTSLMLENAKSGCESLIKRAEISAKSQIVSECISFAEKELKALPDDEYFEALTKLILKYFHAYEQGEICFNAGDIKRMPKNFLKSVNKEIKKYSAELVLAEIPVEIDSGFIIRYGGIEENCTFSSLIEEKIDEIKDKLYSQLMA